MHMIKAIFLVGVAIGIWIVFPVLVAIGGTVCVILLIRYIIKEHADAQEVNRRQNQRTLG